MPEPRRASADDDRLVLLAPRWAQATPAEEDAALRALAALVAWVLQGRRHDDGGAA